MIAALDVLLVHLDARFRIKVQHMGYDKISIIMQLRKCNDKTRRHVNRIICLPNLAEVRHGHSLR
jgi:hypothetical protein